MDKILLKVDQEKKIHFVPLSQLDRIENKPFIGTTIFNIDGSSYEVKDQGVADHPGDLGMKQKFEVAFVENFH